MVEYQPEGGEPIPVTRIEVSTGLDVAVLHLQRPAPAVLPPPGRSRPGQSGGWKPGPKPSDPALTGTVTDPHRQLKNRAGRKQP